MSTIFFTAFITIAVVVGTVALLVILALMANRGQGEKKGAKESATQKWLGWTGWGIFVLAVFDLFRKFVFPNVPIELREWIPGFSWNTLEILIVIIGVVVLWGKREQKKITPCGEKPSAPKNAAPKENYFAEQVAAMAVLTVGLFFWGAIPYEAIPPVPPEGMLYVPLWGLLKVAMVAGLITLLWSFFCDTKTTNGAIFAVILFFGALEGVFFLGISRYWFAPLSSDPLMDTSVVLTGVLGIIVLIQICTKNIEYMTITFLACIAVWLPQLAAKSPGLMGFAHALFR